MGNNRHQLNSGNTEQLWVLGFYKFGDLPSLMHWVLLDSQFLLKEHVAVMARRPFVQLCTMCWLHLFLDQEVPLSVTHGMVTEVSEMVQNTVS